MNQAVFLDSGTLGELKIDADWELYPNTPPEKVVERCSPHSIVITNKVRMTKEIIEKCPLLKLICVAATGVDHMDLEAAKAKGIVVCNVPDYSSPGVIQLTIFFILALFHNPLPYIEDVKQGRWQKSPLFTFLDYPIHEVAGKTLGILGYGKIGKGVAEVAKALGMKVKVCAHKNKDLGEVEVCNLEELLPQVDVLSCHVPLNSQTKNMISKKEFLLMKPSAYLINVARGGIVNESDLAQVLKNKLLAGAALDVLSQEPPNNGNPLLEKGISHLLLTPHMAWGSLESRDRLITTLKNNISSYLKGKPQNCVF